MDFSRQLMIANSLNCMATVCARVNSPATRPRARGHLGPEESAFTGCGRPRASSATQYSPVGSTLRATRTPSRSCRQSTWSEVGALVAWVVIARGVRFILHSTETFHTLILVDLQYPVSRTAYPVSYPSRHELSIFHFAKYECVFFCLLADAVLNN